jgi:prophage maintenance system killer protein
LKLNDVDIDATQEERYHTFLQLAEGMLSEDELAEWICSHLQANSNESSTTP